MIVHFIVHVLGVDYGFPYGHGNWYDFWSGFGSDLSELALLAGVFHMVNCHEKGCWRLGHHVNGTVVCHKHRKGSQ